jgi:hypothetical protein
MVKLSDLVNPALGNALKVVSEKEMNMKMAWALSKLMEDRVAHIKTLESMRKVLLDKYCEKDERGEFRTNETKTQYLIKDEKEYNLEYEELTSVEVECTSLEMHLFDNLGTIAPVNLLALKPFITQE